MSKPFPLAILASGSGTNLQAIIDAVRLARRFTDDVEFSAEDGARTEPEFLEQISKAVVAAGARILVAGSAVFGKPDRTAAMEAIRNAVAVRS